MVSLCKKKYLSITTVKIIILLLNPDKELNIIKYRSYTLFNMIRFCSLPVVAWLENIEVRKRLGSTKVYNVIYTKET